MKEELKLRHKRLYKFMQEEQIDACLISTNVNLLYTTGRIIVGYYYVDINGNNLLFVKRPSGIEGDNVYYIRKPEQIIDVLKDKGLPCPSKVLLEGEEIPHSEWTRLSSVFSDAEIVNGSHLLRKVRSVKTPYEIKLLKESGRLHSLSYASISDVYLPGMTDVELSIEIEHLMRKDGNLGLFRTYGVSMEIYFGSLLAGKNAAAPSPFDFALGGAGNVSLPVGANGTLLEEGMSVMIDMGGNYTGYMSDQTRTFSIGELPGHAYYAHEVTLEIQEELMAMIKPGVTGEEVYQKSLDVAARHNLSDCFMGKEQQAKFIGHGVGLVINELPVLALRSVEPLEVGMVFALEPKFIIDDVGAVGIENTFVITENGVEKITSAEESIVNLHRNLF